MYGFDLASHSLRSAIILEILRMQAVLVHWQPPVILNTSLYATSAWTLAFLARMYVITPERDVTNVGSSGDIFGSAL